MGIWRFLVTNQPSWISNVSNLTAITILGSLIAVYHRFTCDQPRCARFSHVQVKGTTYRTCRKHTTGEVHRHLHALHSRKHPGAHEFLDTGNHLQPELGIPTGAVRSPSPTALAAPPAPSA